MPQAPTEQKPKPILKASKPAYLQRKLPSNAIRYTAKRPEVMRYLFAQHLAYGALPVDAYKESHECVIEREKLNPKQIGDRARSMANSKQVLAQIADFKDELRMYYGFMPEQWLHVMVGLREKAATSGQMGPAIRAQELIGKAAGLFVERFQIERGQLTEDEALAELKRIAEVNPDVVRMILEAHPKMLEAEIVHEEPKASAQAAAGEAAPTPASAATPAESSPTSQAG